ncbi:hypothetical protein F4802DRAFT_306437 [Xylaria palmicola]|nr:hypothetical protein F4802DRAFT_306437 [Xylaria palmicola]
MRISEVRESSHLDFLSSVFSDAIIAMGLDTLRDPVDESRAPSVNGPEHFHSLLGASVDMHAVSSSLLKLQTTILLIIIATNIDDVLQSELLSMGVKCVRELRLNSSNVIMRMFPHADDQKLAKRAVWVLYCLETRFSVACGISPLLHSDFIDHLSMSPDHIEKHDALALEIAGTTLLAKTVSRVYVQPVSAKTTAELHACVSELARWRGRLSDHAKQLVAGRGFEALRGDDEAGAKLRLFCSYHECVYLLFGPWLPPLLESMSSAQAATVLPDTEPRGGLAPGRTLALADTLERCLDSAYTIVSHANEIIAVDKTLAR